MSDVVINLVARFAHYLFSHHSFLLHFPLQNNTEIQAEGGKTNYVSSSSFIYIPEGTYRSKLKLLELFLFLSALSEILSISL